MDFSTSWRHTQERSLVRSMIRLVSSNKLPVGCLPMDFRMEIGECGAKCAVQASRAISIGSDVWLWGMVNEIVSEEILEDVEVPTALHFFGVPADDGFRVVG
jgi:hypothetical protein